MATRVFLVKEELWEGASLHVSVVIWKTNDNTLNTMTYPELDSGAEKGHWWLVGKPNKIVLFSWYYALVYFLVLINSPWLM